MSTMQKEVFKKWRLDRGFTQAEVSKRLGSHIVTVKRWEAGTRKLPIFIGLAMAAIDHDLKPVGGLQMYEDAPDQNTPDSADTAWKSELEEALENPVLTDSQVAEFNLQIAKMQSAGKEPSEIKARILKGVRHFVAKNTPDSGHRASFPEAKNQNDAESEPGDEPPRPM